MTSSRYANPHFSVCNRYWCYLLPLNDAFTVQLEEEEDVYDLVEEDQYAKMVEERRNSNNFVVDDSECNLVRIPHFIMIFR